MAFMNHVMQMSKGNSAIFKVLIVIAGMFAIPALFIMLGDFGKNVGLIFNSSSIIGFGQSMINWGIVLFIFCLLITVFLAWIRTGGR
jgi:hypothetical protein